MVPFKFNHSNIISHSLTHVVCEWLKPLIKGAWYSSHLWCSSHFWWDEYLQTRQVPCPSLTNYVIKRVSESLFVLSLQNWGWFLGDVISCCFIVPISIPYSNYCIVWYSTINGDSRYLHKINGLKSWYQSTIHLLHY